MSTTTGSRGPWRWSITLVAALALAACSDSDSGGNRDGSVRDGAADDGDPTAGKTLEFALAVLDQDRAGEGSAGKGGVSIAGAGDELGVAFYRYVPKEDRTPITCPPPAMGDPNPNRSETPDPVQHLYYKHFDGIDWQPSVYVSRTIGPSQGLDLLFDRQGHQHVGFLGGEAESELSVQECYSSNALVASSDTDGQSWSMRTVDTGTSGVGGDSGGYWMALAEDCDGNVQAAYRNVHYGYYEAEVGWEKADWRYSGASILESNGDGLYNRLLFTRDCKPAVLSYSPAQVGSLGGLRVAVQHGTGTWEIEQAVPGGTEEKPAFATDGNGLYALAYFDPEGGGGGTLYYKESSDLISWTEDRMVDPSATVHGTYASMAFDSRGNPAISYYRKAPAGSQEDFTSDGLMFAYRINGSWKTWEVDTGGDLACGRYTSLMFTPDDQPVIAYECTMVYHTGDGRTYPSIVKVARGVWK